MPDLLIGYRKDVDDVLRAAIARRRMPGSTLICGHNKRDLDARLAAFRGARKALVEELVPEVPLALKIKLRERPPRVGSCQLPSLHTYISYALRHRRCVPNELVEMLASYLPDVGRALARADEPSLKFYRMQSQVLREIDRLRSFTRPCPAGKLMYVEICPEHYVTDLYVDWIARRVSDRASIVKAHRDHFLANAHYLGYDRQAVEISPDEARRLIGDRPADDNAAWEQYYDSQAIESRRNPVFAKTKVPAKCSRLSADMREERNKIEHGIPSRRLDSFF